MEGMTPAKDNYPLLWQLWQEIWQGAGTGEAVERGFEAIMRRWEEPHRAYHTPQHLMHFAQQMVTHKELFGDEWQAALLAMFYHDAVYELAHGEDEENSITVMYDDIDEVGLPRPVWIGRSEDLIRMTINHAAPAEDEIAKVFLDIDMSILGAPPHQYDEYAGLVRREYGRRFTNQAFDQRRSLKFLGPMIASDQKIFLSRQFEPFEHVARSNMARELAAIQTRLARAAYTYP